MKTGWTKQVDRYAFPKCYVTIGKHRSIDVFVNLEVISRTEDEYAEPDPTDKDEDYVDNLRLQGELFFDAFPIGWFDHPINKNVVGELSVSDNGQSSVFNIFFTDKSCEQETGQGKVKRYFWKFLGLGKPKLDNLEIFPEWYKDRKINMNRLYTCTDFRGIWPIGVSSIVVASDKVQARNILLAALKKAGINQPEMNSLTLEEVDMRQAKAIVLNIGEY